MRVTFPRLPDHEIAYAVVERDDGVVYRLQGGRAGTALPHDIRHLVVERELGVTDGIWGGIAAGAVFASMRHLRGRRPPHAAEHSAELKRHYPQVVVIAISGLFNSGHDLDAQAAIALGAARALAKPFKRAELLRATAEVLSSPDP